MANPLIGNTFLMSLAQAAHSWTVKWMGTRGAIMLRQLAFIVKTGTFSKNYFYSMHTYCLWSFFNVCNNWWTTQHIKTISNMKLKIKKNNLWFKFLTLMTSKQGNSHQIQYESTHPKHYHNHVKFERHHFQNKVYQKKKGQSLRRTCQIWQCVSYIPWISDSKQ